VYVPGALNVTALLLGNAAVALEVSNAPLLQKPLPWNVGVSAAIEPGASLG
jgi:hypothetical protein